MRPVRHQTRCRLITKAVGGVIGVAATAAVISGMAAGACRNGPRRVAAVPVRIAPGRTRRRGVGIGIGRRPRRVIRIRRVWRRIWVFTVGDVLRGSRRRSERQSAGNTSCVQGACHPNLVFQVQRDRCWFGNAAQVWFGAPHDYGAPQTCTDRAVVTRGRTCACPLCVSAGSAKKAIRTCYRARGPPRPGRTSDGSPDS